MKNYNIGYFLLIIIGLAGIMDTIVLLTISTYDLGIILPGIVGFIIIIYSIFKINNVKIPLINKNVKRYITILFIVWLISFLIIEGLIISGSFKTDNKDAEAIIVLGAGLINGRPSLALKKRLNKCVEYYNSKKDNKIIVSGGLDSGQEITEAEAMYRYLVGEGINPDIIIKEEKATSTMENFKFSREILDDRIKKVIVITNDFHMFRAKFLAKHYGFIPYGYPSKTPKAVLINCYIREYFAVIKSLIFDIILI